MFTHIIRISSSSSCPSTIPSSSSLISCTPLKSRIKSLIKGIISHGCRHHHHHRIKTKHSLLLHHHHLLLLLLLLLLQELLLLNLGIYSKNFIVTVIYGREGCLCEAHWIEHGVYRR